MWLEEQISKTNLSFFHPHRIRSVSKFFLNEKIDSLINWMNKKHQYNLWYIYIVYLWADKIQLVSYQLLLRSVRCYWYFRMEADILIAFTVWLLYLLCICLQSHFLMRSCAKSILYGRGLLVETPDFYYLAMFCRFSFIFKTLLKIGQLLSPEVQIKNIWITCMKVLSER